MLHNLSVLSDEMNESKDTVNEAQIETTLKYEKFTADPGSMGYLDELKEEIEN